MEETRKRNFSNVGDSEGSNDSPNKRFLRGKEPLLKLLLPNVIAGHIIGKGGSYLMELKAKYGGHIRLSGNKEYYPGTEERVVAVTGKISEIIALNYYIMDKVLNTGREPLRDGRGDKTKIVVTNFGAGMIIGKGGVTIRQIQEECGVKLSIADGIDERSEERVLTMTGTLEQRAEAAKQIISKIAEEPGNMANTNLNYGNGTMGTVGGGGGGPFNGGGARGASNVDSSRERMPYYSTLEPHDDQVVGMIENVAASLDKRQILNALTGVARGGAGQNNNVSRPPRMNALKSKVDLQLEVPSNIVGHLLGKGGQNVKDMVRRSKGARFAFQTADDNSTNGNEEMRTLTITGTFEQVESAYHIVHDSVEDFKQSQPFHP